MIDYELYVTIDSLQNQICELRRDFRSADRLLLIWLQTAVQCTVPVYDLRDNFFPITR